MNITRHQTIAAVTLAMILTISIPSADGVMYNMLVDKPLDVKQKAVPFFEEYAENLDDYIENHVVKTNTFQKYFDDSVLEPNINMQISAEKDPDYYRNP